ncbi:MAG: division/cell wall cluster transcriptional repressor MraZ [Ignavibacteria bacterium]|nr:division/cell wall cluster transcriptional repressor MraZ [Ignavibacteria bacterium]
MLTGKYTYSIDRKGRVSIPVEFRKDLPKDLKSLHLVKGIEDCIYVYSPDSFKKLMDRINALSSFDPKNAYFKRKFLSEAYEKKLDKQFRITIPPTLAEEAKIKDEVIILGQIDRIELWNPELFKIYKSRYTESFEEIAQSVMHGS